MKPHNSRKKTMRDQLAMLNLTETLPPVATSSQKKLIIGVVDGESRRIGEMKPHNSRKKPIRNLLAMRHLRETLPPVATSSRKELMGGGVDGVPERIERIPFQVSIQIKTYGMEEYKHTGGGVLVHPKIVLTAKHCVEECDRTNSKIQWKVVAAIQTLPVTLPNDDDPYCLDPVQESDIERVIYHGVYGRDKIHYHPDIAMIILKKPFRPGNKLKIVDLPSEHDEYPKGVANVSGWGATNKQSTEPSDELMVSQDLPLLDQKDCEELLGCRILEREINELKKRTINESLILAIAQYEEQLQMAKFKASQMLCTLHPTSTPWVGDSGGPLFKNGKVIGIVSTGVMFPNFAWYVRVSKFRTWIDEEKNKLRDATSCSHMKWSWV